MCHAENAELYWHESSPLELRTLTSAYGATYETERLQLAQLAPTPYHKAVKRSVLADLDVDASMNPNLMRDIQCFLFGFGCILKNWYTA